MIEIFVTTSRWVFIFFFISLVLWTAARPGSAQGDALRGSAFTDPEITYVMPDEWVKQPVQYEPSAGNADLVITLGQHLHPLIAPVVQTYARDHALKIIVNKGTCGITAGRLSRKEADIGGYCCAPGVTDRLPGLTFHTVGIAALALIVHPANTVDDVTLEDARGIFTGERYRWSEIMDGTGKRGPDILIHPVARLHCKLRPGGWRLLLAHEDLFSPSIQEVGAIPDMIYEVSENPNAIGYETMTAVLQYFQHKQRGAVKVLKINGHAHDEASHLLSGSYPLYRVFNLTTWNGKDVENPLAQKLVDYLLDKAESIDPRYGVIPASRLREAGWKFHGNELYGEAD